MMLLHQMESKYKKKEKRADIVATKIHPSKQKYGSKLEIVKTLYDLETISTRKD